MIDKFIYNTTWEDWPYDLEPCIAAQHSPWSNDFEPKP